MLRWSDMSKQMVSCGHAANAVKPDNTPCCAICMCDTESETPDLTGRIALCASCRREEPSAMGLPFFSHRPGRSHDSYYCGCRGWD